MSKKCLFKKGETLFAELGPNAVELMVHAQIDPKHISTIAKGERAKMR